MPSKIFFVLFAVAFFVLMGLFFLISPSYKASAQAKVYYMMGEYEQARTLAKEAHKIDRYNRMAATVMAQSTIALEYVDYINEGRDYLARIEILTQKEYLEKADRIRIKFMASIMVERYVKLTHTVLIDEVLLKQAKQMYEQFKIIEHDVTSNL